METIKKEDVDIMEMSTYTEQGLAKVKARVCKEI